MQRFLTDSEVFSLVKEYGSPLYVYSEDILRERATELVKLCPNISYKASYSVKANSNIALTKIIKDCGMYADAVSQGEIDVHMEAGFKGEEIFFIANNVSADEMIYATEKGCMLSLDSISQLRTYVATGKKKSVSLRINSGLGLGHSEKVITAGKNTKFGIGLDELEIAIKIAKEANIKIVGINHHLGSLFLTPEIYIQGAKNLLSCAHLFEDLEFVDFGGGFGVPYRPEEKRLDLELTGKELEAVCVEYMEKTGKKLAFKTEPGRYIAGECGALLGMVTAVKENSGTNYICTDIGFNVLARPVMYDSYHHIDIIQKEANSAKVTANIAGNVCESGDLLAKGREVQVAKEQDAVYVHTAGAYAFAMSNPYNSRGRVAEVLKCSDGTFKLIRNRETKEDLFRGQVY